MLVALYKFEFQLSVILNLSQVLLFDTFTNT
jgi:hypothetical protein